MNYAVARCVFLWLHERLDAYWTRWSADTAADPTRADALAAAVDDLVAFQPAWDAWVATLGG